jgi:Putative auto-transporter adhesin, head GIN domain
MKQLLTFLIVILFLSSCKRENMCDCIKRTGNIETTKRWATNFERIYVEDNLNVFITQDSVFDVEVEAGKNVGWLITTEVDGSTLTIKNKNRCNWTRSYKEPYNIYIHMPVVKYITSDGTGTIKSMNTITTPDFDVQIKNSGNIELTVNNHSISSHIFGYGDVTLHGTTHEHDADIGGSSFLNCKDLHTSITYVHTFTTGQCYVDATDLLMVNIGLNGDVYCYDHPAAVQKTRTGDGQLYLE